MCHDPDSDAAVYSAPVTEVSTRDLVLTGADGASFAAFRADPVAPVMPMGKAGVLVLPDNRGLSPFYERLAVSLAGQGHPALAIDYFGRTAGLDHRRRPAGRDVMPHLMALTKENLYGDFDAAIASLRPGPVVALGFCLGGRFAFLTAAARFGLAGVIGLYGALDEINGAPGPIQLAAGLTAPILGLFGGADQGIPAESIARFDSALKGPHELVVYEGAPHSFFDIHHDAHRQACRDAWARVLAFCEAVGAAEAVGAPDGSGGDDQGGAAR
jgi:carboxymethylenebutenolidase